jgi:parallel beta-helix repeat protein
MKKLLSVILSVLLIINISIMAFHGELEFSPKVQSYSPSSFEQQVIALINGSRAYNYDLELENISFRHPAFRAAGSSGAYEAANWIEGRFASFGLNSSLETFQFTNWTLLSEPSLVIDEDGNQSTVDDQIAIDSFQCEHYSWPTPDDGVFADLSVLPLPLADNLGEIGVHPINMTEWNTINTTGKIVLIGREIRWDQSWQQTFVDKLTAQPPAAVVYTWWYSWMSFCPQFFSSAGGRPLGGFGSYYWYLKIPVGFVNYEDGLWIRNAESANTAVSANVTIRSVINDGTHYNVVGRITGYKNPEKLVIISGHYDTVMCSGFCDNGAGVAGILELAKVFADATQKEIYKPNYTLVFVAFTGEELDLVGSAQYVKQHKNEMANITAVINLDCIGSDNLYVTDTPGSDLNQTIIEAAQDLGISISSEQVGGSDQESFRVPGIVNDDINYYWGVDLGIFDANPVDSSVMLDSYPLFYSDLWSMGTPGWIHTPYDNSTSTGTQSWVEVNDLENHIKVAALTIMRISPNAVPPPPPPPPPPGRLIIVPDNYTTIQEALNNANDNDTIFVRNGTYCEHVGVGKKISLIGENRDTTIIDGNWTGTVVYLGTNATITNFTIRNGEYGVKIWSFSLTPVYTGNTINNCKIIDNLYGAICIRGCANNTISNNIIVNNTLYGIHLWHAGNNKIINNTVVNNRHGIDFYGNSNYNILRNNNMTGNEYNFGLILREETRNFLMGTSSKPGIVNDVDFSNTVNGKPIYYLVNRSDEQIPSDAGYIWLNNCTNITINGCNLSSNLQGILLLLANNASIINNNITNNAYGIYVGIYSSNNTLIGNTLEDNVNGIYLDDVSKFTTMRNNNISGGQMNFGVSPDIARHITSWSDLINDIDTSNTVEGKPIIYWIDQHDRQVPTNAGYIMLINSTNIRIENLELSNNIQNVFLLASNDTIIANSSITDSAYGIVISDYGWYDSDAGILYRFYSFNTTVKGNMLVNNGVGIWIRSNNSTVTNNTLNRNPLGICLAGTSNSTISKNVVIESNTSAIRPSPPPDLYILYYPMWPWEYSRELAMVEMGGIIVGGEHNIIYGNTVRDSSFGIFMFDRISNVFGVSNTVFHNNFIDNTPYQAMGPPKGGNDFYNGYPCGGNYWSNYNGTDLLSGPYRNETGSDGIGDTVFWVFPSLQFQVVDIYPLMAPINIFDAGIWNGTCRDISIISNSSISNFQINKTQNTISFNVTHQTSLVFFRVSIPNVIVHEFWQDNYTVFVNGQPVESRNWTDESNVYIYFTYENPNEVIIIPELSFPIVLLLMMATLLAVTVRKRKSH